MQIRKLEIQSSENLFLVLFIITVAAILRLIHFFEIPYINDEFSALFRTLVFEKT